MRILDRGKFRIYLCVLLVAIFCVQISSSFAVANPTNPTTQNIPVTQTITTIENNSTLENETVNFINGEITNYTFDNLTIGDNVDFMLDVDLANSTADNLTTTNSTGTVYVSTLNFITPANGNSTKVQILKSPDLNLNIDILKNKVVTGVKPTMYNDNILAQSIELGQTTYMNDSIVINGWKDILYEMIEDKDSEHVLKNFIFRTDSEYTLTKDLGALGQETILAISNESGSEYGVLNANNHSMFILNKPLSKVSLNNIYVKNAFSNAGGPVAALDNNTAIFSAKNSVITNNTSKGDGGAFYVKNGTLTLENTTVSNNTSEGQGGAIYTEATVEIIADDAVSTFTGNTANGENNAIYVGAKEGVVNLTAKNNGTINMNDKIDGTEEGYKINVDGDSTGKININNTVKNATIQLNNGVLTPAIESHLDGNNFIGNGGLLNLINGSTGTVAFNEVSIIGNTNIAIDADLRNNSVDRITSAVFNGGNGRLNIKSINVLSDSIPTKVTVSFAEGGIQNAIRNSVKTVYSRIYKYKVTYNKNTGTLTFDRGGGGGGGGGGHKPAPPPASAFNPTILTAGVAQQIAYTNQLQNYQSAMYHSDSYMMLPKMSRKMRNKVSLNLENEFKYCGFNAYQRPIQDEIKSLWVRPYTSFESIPLKRGVSVSNTSYGTIFGGDSDMIELKHGFNLVYGGYIGYNGNSTSYEHIHSTQQGAVGGLTAYLYKGNFFNTITANCGWMINETYTPFGTDTFNLIMSGVADRIGYNFEMASGRFIIQPSIFFGYTFVYTNNYTTKGGVNIKTDPLNVIHFAPTLKFIGNLANGWQPYAIVSIMANFMDKTEYSANSIRLPQMSIDPYVEYGLGIQRRWNENCQGFGQATVRNGGRRGVAVLFGLKYMLGKLASQTTPVPSDNITSKKVKFKDRKDPDIEILDWRTAKKQKKDKNKPYVAKTSLIDKLKSIKKFITLKYNTDVSAKVVTDVNSDGVIITTLKGQDKNGNYSSYIDIDLQKEQNSTQQTNSQEFDTTGVIIIEDKAFAHQEQVATKPANKVETIKNQTANNNAQEKPVKKTDFIHRLNKKYAKLYKINQTNYYKQKKEYKFNEYMLEIIKF